MDDKQKNDSNSITQPITDVKHKHINDNPDSIEFGTPSKGGCIKVYGDYHDKEGFKVKIDNAKEVRKYANEGI